MKCLLLIWLFQHFTNKYTCIRKMNYTRYSVITIPEICFTRSELKFFFPIKLEFYWFTSQIFVILLYSHDLQYLLQFHICFENSVIKPYSLVNDPVIFHFVFIWAIYKSRFSIMFNNLNRQIIHYKYFFKCQIY